MGRHPIRILGIDPGLRRTGWGLIESEGNRLVHVACGSVETRDRDELGARLLAIHDGLVAVIERFQPQEAAVEATFVNSNAAPRSSSGRRAASPCWCLRRPVSPSPNMHRTS